MLGGGGYFCPVVAFAEFVVTVTVVVVVKVAIVAKVVVGSRR